MANLITHGFTYSKEELVEYFLDPMFVDSDIREVVTVRTDIKTSTKLDYISKLSKITKAYAKGTAFNASTGVTIRQRELKVSTVKAQVHQNGRAFLGWVKQWMLDSGVKMNDITGTEFEEIISAVWVRALLRDLQSQMFFNDNAKEIIVSGAPDGNADPNYAVGDYEGFWTLFEDEIISGYIPPDQVLDMNVVAYQETVAVAGADTATLTGASGTANVTINGIDYLATFDTSLATTAANFVAAHAADILARFGRVVITNPSGSDILVTSGVPGLDVTVAVTNVSGDLDATVANTTTMVQNDPGVDGLKTDAAKNAMRAMYGQMTPELRSLKGEGRLRYVCTQSWYDNYMETLEDSSTGIPAARMAMIDGQQRLLYRGIPLVVRPQWDINIEEDFGGVRPHRCVLTVLDNLVFGTDGEGDTALFETWYNKDEQENRMRCEYMGGTQFVHADFLVIAR